jgi:arylsulfatase A-like enzyme
MGRLVERLRDLGLDQDTLLVFLSDHGHELQDHGAMWHGHSLYRELMDVPLFFRWPKGLAGRTVVEERVQLIDVMPTVLELSGLMLRPGCRGAV